MRGENQEFKSRVGVLSDSLRRQNVVRMIESRYPDVVDRLDLIDLDAYMTDEETPAEIFESIEPMLEMLSDADDLTARELQNELEKYEYLRKKFRRREK